MALMEDSVLMLDKKPQIYGSQITENRENREWMVCDLLNPGTVNKRPAKIGFDLLEEYVR